MDVEDGDAESVLRNLEMRVGEVVCVEDFPAAREDLYKIEVDVGGEVLQSAADLTVNYDHDDLLGSQVLAVVNLRTVTVDGFESQCLVVGVDDGDGGVVHLEPERDVPVGRRVY